MLGLFTIRGYGVERSITMVVKLGMASSVRSRWRCLGFLARGSVAVGHTGHSFTDRVHGNPFSSDRARVHHLDRRIPQTERGGNVLVKNCEGSLATVGSRAPNLSPLRRVAFVQRPGIETFPF